MSEYLIINNLVNYTKYSPITKIQTPTSILNLTLNSALL